MRYIEIHLISGIPEHLVLLVLLGRRGGGAVGRVDGGRGVRGVERERERKSDRRG
jgi:hypothetical protein